MEFPTKCLEDTSIHLASMLTDSNPTDEDIDRGNTISNKVKAADLDTFSTQRPVIYSIYKRSII